MLLGAMIKQLHPHHLIWPKPSEPFIGFSFAKSATTVRGIRSPAWCDMPMRTTAARGSDDEEIHFGTKKKKGKHRNPWGIVELAEEAPEVQECPQHLCTLQDLLFPKMDRLEHSIKGLDLEKIQSAATQLTRNVRKQDVSGC